MNKYRAVKVTTDGYSFASKLESSVYTILKSLENEGRIKILQHQDQIRLTRAGILYIPDFRCISYLDNQEYWVESKGFETQRWPTIKKLWKFYGPGRLEIYKGSHQRPFLAETIIPVEN